MTRKRKRLLVIGTLLGLSLVSAAIGWRYLPINKVMKVNSGSEKEFANPQQIRAQAPNTLYFDFEVAPGKETPAGFSKGIAHSGQYAVKAFGQNSYSVAIERKAGEIGLKNLKSVALSAWVYVKPTNNEVTAALVFAVSNELGVNVTWQAVALREPLVPREKWFKIAGNFDLSSITFKPDYKIQIYFWNNSRTDILVDDYFISFGGPVERRGDTTLVDLTKGEFIPRFNQSPYPVEYLYRSEGTMIPAAAIGTSDLTAAADLLTGGSDELLVVKNNSRADLWVWCDKEQAFLKTALSLPPAVAPCGPVRRLHRGRFLPQESEQILLEGEQGCVILVLDGRGFDPCRGDAAAKPAIRAVPGPAGAYTLLSAGDFNGDRQTELLAISPNGSWQLFRHAAAPANGWKSMATGNNPVKQWVKGAWVTGMTAGRFRPGNADLLLAVSKPKTGKTLWTLLRFNTNSLRWEPLYPPRTGHPGETLYTGHTVGNDTLLPADALMVLPDPGTPGGTAVYWYCRDWRFDLKKIRFNDSTFQVLSNVDFRDYPPSQNPKFYETLRIVPAMFAGTPGLFLHGRVARERHYEKLLPDFTDIYTFEPTGKN